MPTQLWIEPPPPGSMSRGRVPLPADEAVLLPRIALSVLARGRSSFRVPFLGREADALVSALEACGVEVQRPAEGAPLVVGGRGLEEWTGPASPLDARGAAHAGALMIGLLAGRPQPSELWVDRMVADTLGAVLADLKLAELEVIDESSVRMKLPAWSARTRPPGLDVASAGLFSWVKESVTLLALRCGTVTRFEERYATADHLERALLGLRAPLVGEGTALELHPPRDGDALAPQIVDLVGSPGALAAVVACMTAWDSGIVGGRDVGLNPARSDLWSAIRGMGFDVQILPEGDRQGEPTGSVTVAWGQGARPECRMRPRPLCLGGEASLRWGDDVLSLFVLACDAAGTSVFSDLLPRARGGDPRVIQRAVGVLRSAGLSCEIGQHELSIQGRGREKPSDPPAPLRPLTLTSGGDPRLVLLATALALRAEGPSVIDDVDCLGEHFPRWTGTLRALGARVGIQRTSL